MAAETEPDDTAATQSIMNVTPEPISTPAPEYDELQAYTADNDTTYVAMQEGKVYLSDMPWKSATNGWGPAERDMNNKESLPNDGDTITINGVQYEKGIGCHTVSNIEIELGKGYDLFETVVGVDDYTPPGSGNVKFSVYGDGELLAQTDYMTGSDDGQALSVDVGNVQVLKLSATNNGSNNHNHADWADAKLTPKTQTVDMGYFGYCGEYYDPELDMIYLRNRYYSPGIGRFITEDPARDGANWYAYANNNPVKYSDPSGLDAIVANQTENIFGAGHMSSFVQDDSGIWYFFYWGNNSVSLTVVDDSGILKDSEKINTWLEEKGLSNGEYKYDGFCYILGDFSESKDYYQNLAEQFAKDVENNDIGWFDFQNKNYNFVTRNCTQETMQGLYKGKIGPNGEQTVEQIHNKSGYKIAISPNANLYKLQNIYGSKTLNWWE